MNSSHTQFLLMEILRQSERNNGIFFGLVEGQNRNPIEIAHSRIDQCDATISHVMQKLDKIELYLTALHSRNMRSKKKTKVRETKSKLIRKYKRKHK